MSAPGSHKPFPPLMGDTQPGQTPGQPAAINEIHSSPATGEDPAPDAAGTGPKTDSPSTDAAAALASGAEAAPQADPGASSAMHPALAASLEAAIRMRQAQESGTENLPQDATADIAEQDPDVPGTGGAPGAGPVTDAVPKESTPAPEDEESQTEKYLPAEKSPSSVAGYPSFADGSEDEEEDDEEDDGEYEDDDEDEEDEDGEDDDADEEEEEGTMSLRDHLRELRKRVVRAFLFALLGFFCCYPFAEQIYGYLLIPLLEVMPPDSMLIYTSVPEAFFTYLKVAFFVGIFAASPFIFYQIWAFVAPGLYREEKMYIVPVAVMSAVCFIGGGAFCFFVVFPIAFEFFMSYNVGRIQAMPSLKEYLSFVLQLIFAFGLVFEMPLFIFFLARLGLVTAAWLRKFRRYMILICFIVAAILTPPDVLSQLLMAGPMILLYEVSILLAAAFGKKAAPPAEDAVEEDDGDEDEEDAAEDGDTEKKTAE